MIKPDWIAPGRTALLLIDFQVDFGAFDGAMARCGADMAAPQAALAEAESLVDAARAAGVAVVFVRLLNRSGGNPIARETWARKGGASDLCREGSPGADFIGPQPRPGELIVSKSQFSAFTHTGLAEQLRSRGLDTLVLAGLTTECCVAASAWAAFEQDFHVFIAGDACAAYEEELHRQTLRALAFSGAVVAEAEAFAASWKK